MQIYEEIYPFERIKSPSGFPSSPPHTTAQHSQNQRKTRFYARCRTGLRYLYHQIRALATLDTLLLLPLVFVAARANILGELYPFGFALLTALGCTQRERIGGLLVAALLGMASTATGFQLASAATYGVLVLSLLKLPRLHVKSSLSFALLTGCSIFFTKTLLLLPQGILYYQEMILIMEALLGMFFTYIFLFSAEIWRQKRHPEQFSFEEISSMVLLGGVVLLGISDWSIYGVHLCSVLCCTAILCTSYLWGSGGGTMMGVTAGIIPALTTGLFTETLSMYAVSGLLAGWFRRLGRFPVIMAFFSGVLAISFYTLPFQLTLHSLEEGILSAFFFYFTVERLKRHLPARTLTETAPEPTAPQLSPALGSSLKRRLHEIAQVFNEISRSLSLPDEPLPDGEKRVAAYTSFYEKTETLCCRRCQQYASCWQTYRTTLAEDLLSLERQLEAGAVLTLEKLPERLRRRCIHPRALTEALLHSYEIQKTYQQLTAQMAEHRQLVAQQLQDTARIVRNLATASEHLFPLSAPPDSEKPPVFLIETGAAQHALEQSCGDSFALLALPEHQFAAILSDGMGSGDAARHLSQTVIRLMQSMLQSGFALRTILTTINTVLLLRSGSESFATLDLFLADLSHGEAHFIKTAAAPTLLRRQQKLRAFHASSLPIGILQELDVHSQALSLEEGDLIVLFSDGLTDARSVKPPEEWLKPLLLSNSAALASCQALAHQIISCALEEGAGADDITVICLRIKRF